MPSRNGGLVAPAFSPTVYPHLFYCYSIWDAPLRRGYCFVMQPGKTSIPPLGANQFARLGSPLWGIYCEKYHLLQTGSPAAAGHIMLLENTYGYTVVRRGGRGY
jgi:hypothetical protein